MTGRAAPDVVRQTWTGYKLIHPYRLTRRHAWRVGKPPAGREMHPVVLVSYADAGAYLRWLSKESGVTFRLSREAELEKALRGTEEFRIPWGDTYEPELLNSHDKGPVDTMPVGSFPRGISPFGFTDAAEQVFESTSTAAGLNRYIVKGGSLDDNGCGICRPAAWHFRPETLKHILVSFRLVRE